MPPRLCCFHEPPQVLRVGIARFNATTALLLSVRAARQWLQGEHVSMPPRLCCFRDLNIRALRSNDSFNATTALLLS
ncbi:hypothetical protein, partial [Thermoflexus sp.]|uniref:hypothetical protein n=1 Tax=Thermoflexus sp. TaxID=1969742 RepID=UPI00262779E6